MRWLIAAAMVAQTCAGRFRSNRHAQDTSTTVELCPPVRNASDSLLREQKALLAGNMKIVQDLLRDATLPPKLMAVLKPTVPLDSLPAPPEDLAVFYEQLEVPPDAYGVESVTDAIAVRHAVQSSRTVMSLYPVEVELAPLLSVEGIEVAVSSEEWVNEAAGTLRGTQRGGARLGVHAFVDTGMARIGAAPEDAGRIVEAVLRNGDALELRGVMTHFCCTSESSWLQALDNESRRIDAATLHQQQMERTTALFINLARLIEAHRKALPAAPQHRVLFHAGATDIVEQGQSDMFYDMVRVGEFLFRDVTELGVGEEWSGRPHSECVVARLGGCQRSRPRVQALKTLPGKPGSEWSLYYACSEGDEDDFPCYSIDKPVLVAVVSGVCHQVASNYPDGEYTHVAIPVNHSATTTNASAIGDCEGSMVLVPDGSFVKWNMSLSAAPAREWGDL